MEEHDFCLCLITNAQMQKQ